MDCRLEGTARAENDGQSSAKASRAGLPPRCGVVTERKVDGCQRIGRSHTPGTTGLAGPSPCWSNMARHARCLSLQYEYRYKYPTWAIG